MFEPFDRRGQDSGSPESDIDPEETSEWIDALKSIVKVHGKDRAAYILKHLQTQAQAQGVPLPFEPTTPYINTIRPEDQPEYPGDRKLEARIRAIIRWNAMAMVVKANKHFNGIGGHLSTYASAAHLYEVGFNHFFRGKWKDFTGDQIYFQGHASPGIYARAWMLGRLTDQHLENFRRELQPGGGLSSYPHPWLMPDFWEYPTVSMGLAPLMAIYQARFNRYLQDRGIRDTSHAHVWAFLGDGETDEPETLGAISLAAREQLDNLIFVINCNLQRLDGPVRGNGKIIQELEANFRGNGWNVIKVIWGSDWDELIAKDSTGELVRRAGEVVDGEYQKYVVEGGAYIREHFFNTDTLKKMVEHMSDEQLAHLSRGGHDEAKLYAAYQNAVECKGRPTVILAKTIKGFGLGDAAEGKNVTHQQKKLDVAQLKKMRDRFQIPVPDDKIEDLPFYKPADDAPEMVYLRERRLRLGGYAPARHIKAKPLEAPGREIFAEFYKGSTGRPVSTTMAYVRMLTILLQDKNLGKLIVPIVPDEARTFGMDALFRQIGIYSHIGQRYEPVDKSQLMYYREAKDGQLLEEGITEAGSMSSWIAAGTAWSTHGVNTIPLFIYYSMFGFQRIADLIWAAADARAKGFLLGATAGRTTLPGEGLQHQDGHSHVFALTVPNCMAYDPAYAYEIAIIIQDGIKRMYQNGEAIFYYITVMNENYEMPAMPEGAEDGILRGMYLLRAVDAQKPAKKKKLHVNLMGSGTILNEVVKAAQILAEKFGVASSVYSATSYKELRRDAMECERWNMLHPEQEKKRSYLAKLFDGAEGPFVSASDYMRTFAEQIAPYLPGKLTTLGTDGFGRSETREALRRFFEVDAAAIVVAALHALAEEDKIARSVVTHAIAELGINPEQPAPWTV
ncbi:MAG: pyruvate dehydrogenase (acetyl-transferring), homodimeric type [Deltaproteobacteria bacterium]|nr:pyruvate dehydrogenase (acetyl-transferring), homodimeric type [Deltaproteobacteria bacterium]